MKEGREYLKESVMDLGFSDCFLHGTETCQLMFTLLRFFNFLLLLYFLIYDACLTSAR